MDIILTDDVTMANVVIHSSFFGLLRNSTTRACELW